jgi:SAM-dependent methyltransferase
VGLIGVDANEDLLQVAQARCKSARLLNGDACRIPLGDRSADIVFALHVVEHLTAPSEFFSEAWRVLRPGGHLIIATPNADGLGARLMKETWQGFSDPTHIALNTASFWRGLVTSSGFTVLRDGTTGLTGIPWLNRMPLGLIHWVPTFFFGFYPWELGEAYICVALKQGE